MEVQFQKIEQFLILINNTKGKALESLILHLLSDQDLYSFSQFLRHENIKELSSEGNPSKPFLEILRIFSFGDFREYLENATKLPNLTENQIKKLRKLTILKLASKNKTLFYEDLFRELDLKTEIDLEEIVIEMIYQDLLLCKIDQRCREIQVSSCKGRDIKPGQVNEIKKSLKKILENTAQIEAMIQSKIDFLNEEKTKHVEKKKASEKQEREIKDFIGNMSNFGRPEGNRPMVDYMSKSDGRK